MYTRFVVAAAAVASAAFCLNAQPRRASIVGGQSGDRGKCTIEVVVDISAEVEVRGDTAMLRTLNGGQPAQWRRFECSAPMPSNPGDFRYAGVDGRGKQFLVRDPRQNGGTAVVHIDDPKGGSEGYTFDLIWHSEGGGYPPPPVTRGGYPPERRDADAYYRERDEAFRGDWRGRFFDRVRMDLEHAEATTFPVSHDEFRIARTKQELNELQSKLAAGRYDERELDDVIQALQRVVQDNRMSPRDRDVLSDDLRRMREFRERHNDWGAHDGGAGRGDDAYYRDRDDAFRGENWRAHFFDRVRQDVEHAESVTFPFGRDQWRLERTKQELNELQGKMTAGRYDQRELDDVIDAMQRVVADNRLAGRDRDVLSDDLRRLREFRERHEAYGAR